MGAAGENDVQRNATLVDEQTFGPIGSPEADSKHDALDEADVNQQPELEKEDETSIESSPPPTADTADSKTVISFSLPDPEDPHNWRTRKKVYTVFVGVVLVINSTIGSSEASGAADELAKYFNVKEQSQLVLLVSIYLVGYTVGPLVFGPLSESYGRKYVMICTFVGFIIFTLACALAPNWPALLIFRLLAGVSASSPVAIVGG
ncbi:hypothetical protein LTR66_014240 [Elasticomyces elasticus]|nr:hypothetical protein LTR66_014240 [Elasticomyces elasticus]